LPGFTRRVVRARILVAVVRPAGARLGVSRGLRDRRHDGAGLRIGRLTTVSAEGGQIQVGFRARCLTPSGSNSEPSPLPPTGGKGELEGAPGPLPMPGRIPLWLPLPRCAGKGENNN